jgi:hypothetical protein
MGLPPSTVVQMAETDWNLLARYWDAEPWGPWRDNMHAALICRELRRPHLKDPTSPTPLDVFMLRDPEEIEQIAEEKRHDRVKQLFGFFGAVARKVKASDLMKMKRPPRSKRRRKGVT